MSRKWFYQGGPNLPDTTLNRRIFSWILFSPPPGDLLSEWPGHGPPPQASPGSPSPHRPPPPLGGSRPLLLTATSWPQTRHPLASSGINCSLTKPGIALSPPFVNSDKDPLWVFNRGFWLESRCDMWSDWSGSYRSGTGHLHWATSLLPRSLPFSIGNQCWHWLGNLWVDILDRIILGLHPLNWRIGTCIPIKGHRK